MKDYLEKSLKRYLKRKVKITLGFVTAFTIMGNTSLAVQTQENEEAQQEFKDKITAIEKITEKFKGIGTFDFTLTEKTVGDNENSIAIKVEKVGDINKITIGEKTIEIDKNYITDDVKTKVDSVIGSVNNVITSEVTENDVGNNQIVSIKANAVVNGQKTTDENQSISNNGIIINNSSKTDGQSNKNDKSEITNDGVIIANRYGQYIEKGKEINNGLIFSVTGQGISNKGNSKISAINNGLIISSNSGQIDNQGNGEIINNRIIISEKVGQNIGTLKIDNGIGINYGIITSKSSYAQNLMTGGFNGKLENYGIMNGGQQSSGEKGVTYNYGLINSNNDYTINVQSGSKGYNYGVVKSLESEKIFTGDVTNKGIVITNKDINFGNNLWAQTGAVVDSSYNLKNVEYVQEFENGAIIDDNTFAESGKSVGYVKDKNVQIDNLTGKTIGAVVTKDSNINSPVFTYTGSSEDGLFLNDTVLTGYFEKDGTLLDVGGNKLVLGGESKITAVKSDLDLDVVAVKVGEGGSLTLSGNTDINGVIEGLEDSDIDFVNYKKQFALNNSGLTEIKNLEEDIAYVNYTNTTFASGTTKGLQTDFTHTSEGLVNRIVINDGVTLEKADGEDWAFKDTTQNRDEFETVKTEVTFKNINNSLKGDIIFGEGKNSLIVDNTLKIQDKENPDSTPESFDHKIDLGTGNDDKFVVNYNQSLKDENSYNTFNYNVTNAETVELSGGNWKVGTGSINFDNNIEIGGNHNATLRMSNGAIFDITLSEINGGSDLANVIKDGGLIDKTNTDLVLSTDKTGKIRYQISENGLDFTQLSTEEYSISSDANVVAPIFNVSSDGKNGVDISVKTAQEAGVGGYKPIYDAIIKELSSDIANKEVIDRINNMTNTEDIKSLVDNTNTTAQAYYTAGTMVTKNIADSYISSVEDFGRKAGRGEWIATAKFINSDTEFDGGSRIKGYDGDINSAVGIIEYGATDDTSYGAVFGGGKTEIDINGGGKLDGDNYYIGAYVKHRTENKIDILGNIGFVKSDLDSELTQEFKFTSGDISLDGKSNVDGTADSQAFTASVLAKKDYYITDNVKLQPLAELRYTLIQQDEAENKDMGFLIQKQDVSIFEATAGMNIAKEINLEKGIFEINAGVKYTFAGTSEDEDVRYNLYSSQNLELKIEGAELGDDKGTAHIGFDYEHETGFGINGKYEMMWSDSGDDDRITAGISYRF